MKDFILKQISSKCLQGLLLGILFILPGQTCAASASRSLISRAVASARNHPVMTAAGVVGTGYLLYKWLHKKQVALPSPVLPKMLGSQPEDHVQDQISKKAHAFQGKQIHNFGNEAGLLFALVALPGDRFASGHSKGYVKIWNAKTGECEQTIKISGEVFSLCLIDEKRMLVGADTDVYLLDLGSQKIQPKPISFNRRISKITSFLDETVVINFDQLDHLFPVVILNTQTGKRCVFCVQFGSNDNYPDIDITYFVQLDPHRFFVVSTGKGGWFGTIAIESVRKSYREQKEDRSAHDLLLKREDFQFITSNKKAIFCAAVSHDNKLILSSWGDEIRIFDGSSGSFIKKIEISLIPHLRSAGYPAYSILELSHNIIVVATETNDHQMYFLTRDEQGNIAVSKKCVGVAPLLLLPQGLVASSPEGEITLMQ